MARKRRRLTGKALATLAGMSAVHLSRLEKGNNQPDAATVENLSEALGYPLSFFYDDDPEEILATAVSFRSLSKMSAKVRDAAISAGVLGLQLADWVEDRFNLPKGNLLDLSYETSPEAAARSLRQHWALGEKPVSSMIALLETHGVRVFSLSEDTALVDAFSFWRNDTPFVFLNNQKSAERSVFDAAHELGHLVLHLHAGPSSSRDAEREADAFASAFLMPANDVKSRMPRRISIATILKAKRRWRVSAFAMVYRLRTLGLLTEWQYKSNCIELGKRGYRSREIDGIDRETSVVWKKVFSQLWSERTTKSEIAESLHLPLDELEGIVWGLSGHAVRPTNRTAKRLSAVK